MQRVLEPELMEEQNQVRAYAEADFTQPNEQFIDQIRKRTDGCHIEGPALDLGCGPGDISCRFARAFPRCCIDAIDGSQTMLGYAESLLPDELQNRIKYTLAMIPDDQLPRTKYDIIFSNSLLHHLPDPLSLWNTIKHYGKRGGYVFVMDLLRPGQNKQASDLVQQYAADEPAVLQHDFYHSLLAAFTLDEINQQLSIAGLNLSIEKVSDRHLFISGIL